MLERLLFTLILLAAGVVIYQLSVRNQIRRTSAFAQTDPLLQAVKPGVPTILYFTTPTCAPCRTQQTPALARLQSELGDAVQIVRVDATEHPEDADRWGVFSAPTTFIIDASGHTRAVNHGVADDHKLKRQLQEAVN
ncbi:MAG TPA: thioredoxin family protein [Oceanobacillus sp.]|nr:thioredoxin family protein [Oceanobacillus sp.]